MNPTEMDKGLRPRDDRAEAPMDAHAFIAGKVAEVGSMLCAYSPGHGNPAAWALSRCDCKYGASGVGEQNGCAEMRSVYLMLMPRPWCVG